MAISRRDALKSMAAAGAAVATTPLIGAEVERPTIIADPRQHYPNTSTTEDLYRQEFETSYGEPEEHGYAFHCVNCQGNCAWEIWVNDGKVTRENQSANYPAISPNIPDANPRGCNKGAQHSQIMYEADRLMYPMKRVGERGAGKWERLSWDDALTEIAQNLYNTMRTTGPAGNYIHVGAGVLSEARGAAFKRMGSLLGAVRPYIASYVGDMFPGVSLVYGEGNIGCSFDFMFNTDVQVYWGANPNTTRIPDAHYLWEGKYNGSKVIVITPEFSSTAIHADLWVPINPGYDGHLALSMMHVIIENNLYDESLLKTYTDLPFLVREDNQKMLTLADIDTEAEAFDSKTWHLFEELGHGHESHPHEIFLSWNKVTGKVTAMPGCEGSPIPTLRLKDLDWHIDPALKGTFEVQLADGSMVRVRPAFQSLIEELKNFSPEATQGVTGVHPDVVAELANDIALPDVVSVTMGFSLGKHFNGLLTQRAISSLVALTVRMGNRGGLNTENEWSISGLGDISSFAGKYKHRFASGFVSEFLLGDGFKGYEEAFTEEDVKTATGQNKADYRKAVEELLDESLNDQGVGKGKSHWDTIETFFVAADARFRRNKGHYTKAFLKKAKFFAYVDFRMSETAKFADILLPAASHYEVFDLRTNPGYHRFANVSIPGSTLKQVGEARSEWHIAAGVIEKLQEIALAAAVQGGDEALNIPDPTHSQTGFRELDQIVDLFSDHGKLGTDRQAVEQALIKVPQFGGETLESTYNRGGFLQLNEQAGKTSPLYPDKPYSTFENNFQLLQRFETLSGRLTFYVDHPLWIEAGANIPTAKEPLRSKKYPFLLMTPHARWSIHSTYKTSPILLRLQRGVPYVMISPEVADPKGIKDGDTVILFNDLAEIPAMAKIMPSIPRNALVMEHGWEPFMFKGGKGHNSLVSDMLNLLEVSGGWGHLKFGVNWDGNQHAYSGSIDLKLA